MNNQQKIKLFDAMKRLASSKKSNESFNPFMNHIYYSQGIYYATNSVILVFVNLGECDTDNTTFILKRYIDEMMNFQPFLKGTERTVKTLKDIIKNDKLTINEPHEYDPKVIKEALTFYSLAGMYPKIFNYEKTLRLEAIDNKTELHTIIMPVRR